MLLAAAEKLTSLLHQVSCICWSSHAYVAHHPFYGCRQLSVSQGRAVDAHQQLSHKLPPAAHQRTQAHDRPCKTWPHENFTLVARHLPCGAYTSPASGFRWHEPK